ncbi:helix-turn-helix domain-containing protein [Bradyrhizobium sp. BRP22]|uniref:helix-turn-helix domain-containing protein n=1 Tax=Bradyrhizobium sp. BRP22 TaxID=2793821 RepID=UPI001CD60CFC|nr:helix-turn-helix domain-containing protein [Bradyrhizobium sp. BRP22]MCA1452175.1 helix-turn-helix domain-containing protein [Bradyrhizobium sp. BRP22]
MRAEMRNKVFVALSKDTALAAKLAQACGIGRSAVCMWPNRVPARHALKVAEFMGLHPSEVRPDLYPTDFDRRFANAR